MTSTNYFRGNIVMNKIARVFFIAALFVLSARFLEGEESPTTSVSAYTARFDEICKTVENNFFDQKTARDVLSKEKPKYRARLDSLASKQEFGRLINDMLSKLHASHTAYYTPNDWEYYQLAEIFHFLPEVKKLFKGSEITYPSIGILTKTIDGKVFITSVLTGSPANKAGLQAGYEIIEVDGKPYSPIQSFRDCVGRDVVMIARRTDKGDPIPFTVRPVMVNPQKEFLEAERQSVTVFQKYGKKIGYIHIWSYAGEEYQQAFTDALAVEPLKTADALILDVRYGWGGANPEYLNVFNNKTPIISGIDRFGKVSVYDSQWRKPVLLLVNNSVRSGKEVLAYGFKKYKLGTVMGENTAGAVLGGKLFVLSDGSVLLLAAMNSLIDGVQLEGVGVKPDILVPMDIRYSQGRDIQLMKGIDYLGSNAGDKK